VCKQHGTLNDQIQMMQQLQSRVSAHEKINWMKDINDSMTCSTTNSEIYLPAGCHSLKFLDFSNGNQSLIGLNKFTLANNDNDTEKLLTTNAALIECAEMDFQLFTIDGDFKFENLIFDCRKVKTGFVIKGGIVSFKNCIIIGSNDNCMSEGFSICGVSKVCLNECIIANFSVGVMISEDAQLNMHNVMIKQCENGMTFFGDKANVLVDNCTIKHCVKIGIVKYSSLAASKVLDELKTNLVSCHFEKNGENVKVIPKTIQHEDEEKGDVIFDESDAINDETME
jgi:hypothetical protein